MSLSLKVSSIVPSYHLPLAYSTRNHTLLVLPNGLKCLLIYDPSSEMMCGAVTVNCGAFNDPPNVLGLAHLTEHLILRGSKTHKSGSLGRKLAESGGQLNAYTTSNQSCFYFQVSTFAANTVGDGPSIVESILPIFSSYLTCPLLNERYVSQEILAVDDEHNGNRNNQEKVLFHGYRLLANPKHVFSRFATGNFDTLSLISSKKIKSMAKSYFSTNFTPQNMSLVFKGPQTVLQLKKMVLSEFMSLGSSPKTLPHPNDGISTSESTLHLEVSKNEIDLFITEGPNTIVLRTPFAPKIRISFPIYLMKQTENYNPTVRSLCNLLGEEGPESLSSLLSTEKGWISSLFVFVQTLYSDVQMLVIDLEPTKSAWSHLKEIVHEIISYLKRNIGECKEETLNILADYYSKLDEYNIISQPASVTLLDDVLDYAERLNRSFADAMQPNFISSFKSWSNISAASQTIKNMISVCFTECLVKVIILAPPEVSVEQTIRIQEEYFGFEYELSRLDFDNSPQFDFSEKKLPSPRAEIVGNMISRLKNSTRISTSHMVRGFESELLNPHLVSYDQSHEIWKSTNPQTSYENLIVTVAIRFPHIRASATNSVILDLLVELVGNELRGPLYDFEKIGSFWGLFSNINRCSSIMVTTSGSQDAVESMLLQIFATLRETADRLNAYPYAHLKKARVNLRKRYEQSKDCSNITKVLSASYVLLEEGIITPREKMESLELVDEKCLKSFKNQFLNTQEYLSVVKTGELNTSCLTNLYIVGKNYGFGKELRDPSSVVLRDGSFYLFETETREDDNISVVMHYTQIGSRSDTSLFVLAKFYLYLVSTTAMDELRIQRQLSYSVYSGLRMFHRQFGIYILIPSAWHACSHLTDQVEEFLQVVEEMVTSYSEEEFHEQLLLPFIQALSSNSSECDAESGLFSSLQPQKGSGDKPCGPEFCEHWNHLNQILNSTYKFKSKNCEEPWDVNLIRGISRKEFLEFIGQHMHPKSLQRSVLVICSHPFNGIEFQRKQVVSRNLFQKMERLDINIDEDSILDALLKCENAEAYGDAFRILSKRYPNQKIKLKRLQLEAQFGNLLLKVGVSLGKFSLMKNGRRCFVESSVPMVRCSDYHQIHRESSVAPTMLLTEKFEKLIRIEEYQENSIY